MLLATPIRGRGAGRPQCLGGVMRELVDIADVQPACGAGRIDLDRQADAVVHRHGQRLGAAHPAEPRGERDAASQAAAEVLAGKLGEGLERALEDPLGADVDPGAGGHLAVHHQALPLELAEVVPGRPLADEVRVRDEHARRPLVRAEDADGLAALDEQRLVVREAAELADDGVEGVPAPRGAAGAAIDDEVVGVLRDLGIEVVHEHPQRRFLRPAAAGELGAAWRADGARPGGRRRGARHRRRVYVPRIASVAQPLDDAFAEPARLADRYDGDDRLLVGQVDVVGVAAAAAGADERLVAADLRLGVARPRRRPARSAATSYESRQTGRTHRRRRRHADPGRT